MQKQGMRRIVGMILRGVGYLVLLILAAVGVASLFRGGSDAGYIGQFLVAYAGMPMVALLFAGCGLCIWRWRRTRLRTPLTIGIAGAAGMLATLFTLSGYFAAAKDHDLGLNYARMFWPWQRAASDIVPSGHVYDRFEGEEARLHVYRASRTSSAKAPVLVYIHGGGWVQGSSAMRHDDLQWFAEQGYIAIGVEYALSSKERHLWNITEPQIGCSLAWISRNAERLGADLDRLAIFGESAGGNLVLNVGGKAHRGELPNRCAGAIPDVKAIISIYPPVDLVALYNHEPARQFATAYIGAAPSELPARYAAVSPITDAGEPAPPTLIITGLDDSLVPVEDTLRFAETARSSGQSVSLITIPRAGHGFDANPGSPGRQIVRGAIAQFLDELRLSPNKAARTN